MEVMIKVTIVIMKDREKWIRSTEDIDHYRNSESERIGNLIFG